MRNNDQQDSSRKNETNNQLLGITCVVCNMWVLLNEYFSHMNAHCTGPHHCSPYGIPSLSSSYGFPSSSYYFNHDESVSLATNMVNSTSNGGRRFEMDSAEPFVNRSKKPKIVNDEQCILSLQCPKSNNKQKSIDQHASSRKAAKHPQYNEKKKSSRDGASSSHAVETKCTTSGSPLSVAGGESSKPCRRGLDIDLNEMEPQTQVYDLGKSREPCTRRFDTDLNVAVSGERGEQARKLFIRGLGIDLNKVESSEGGEQSRWTFTRRLDFDLNEVEVNDSGEGARESVLRELDVDLNEVELDETKEGTSQPGRRMEDEK